MLILLCLFVERRGQPPFFNNIGSNASFRARANHFGLPPDCRRVAASQRTDPKTKKPATMRIIPHASEQF
jgi:hypothetical protein